MFGSLAFFWQFSLTLAVKFRIWHLYRYDNTSLILDKQSVYITSNPKSDPTVE